MTIHNLVRLLDKLGHPIAKLARMACPSRDIVVNKQGYTMHLVLVHRPAKFRLGHFENLGGSGEQRPHHSLPILIGIDRSYLNVEHELKHIAHKGRPQSVAPKNLRYDSALLAIPPVFNLLTNYRCSIAIIADMKPSARRIEDAQLPVTCIAFPDAPTCELNYF